MKHLSRRLFALSRSGLVHPLVRLGFARFSRLIPVRRLRSTGDVLAFHHPRPSWEMHILVVPKRGIAGLMMIGEREMPSLAAIFNVAREIAPSLAPGPVSLVINGGAWQDVGQIHAHLAAGVGIVTLAAPDSIDDPVMMHPQPARPFHAVITPPSPLPEIEATRFTIRTVQRLVREHNLAPAGFAIVVDPRTLAAVHLISGPAPN